MAEPRAYLTTIAQRLLADHLRRRQIERAYLDALVGDGGGAPRWLITGAGAAAKRY